MFIEFIGEFYFVVEVFYYLFCLMYIVLNNVLMCLIGMCVRVRYVMIWEVIMVKGFLNRD